MKLKILGSGSKGNCYLLQNKDETLILECGISYKELLLGLGFNLKGVVGCLITHEHKDHSKAINDMLKNGIDIYTSKGTAEAIGVTGHRLRVIKSEKQFTIGGFTILPFEAQHDAAEPLGFLIQHPEMGKLLFITDSYYCQYKFSGVNHILIECNYSSEILAENIEHGYVPWALRNRLIKSHFSLDNVKEFLKTTNIKNTREIVLIHLSDSNSNASEFKEEVEKLTGKPVYIANKGLNIELF